MSVLRAPIAKWSVWGEGLPCTAPSDDKGAADVRFVEPMLRRRLGRLARMGLCVAAECVPPGMSVRFVFASRHGDLHRTYDLLELLARDDALSPTNFSLSVLNAVPGLYSILRGDRSASTAVSASEESFGFALLEAAGQLRCHPDDAVLLVYADEPVPSFYDPYVPIRPPAHAIAILLRTDAKVNIQCEISGSNATESAAPQSLAFLQCVRDGTTSAWHSGSRRWEWTYHA